MQESQQERQRKDKKIKEDNEIAKLTKQLIHGGNSNENVLETDVITEYKPTTSESRNAYENLIKFIENKFGYHQHQMMISIAHEILLVTKNEEMAPMKMWDVLNQAFKGISQETFSKNDFQYIMKISRNINDFSKGSNINNNIMDVNDDELNDNDNGVAVTFDDNMDGDSKFNEINDDNDDSSADDFISPDYADPDMKFREIERKRHQDKEIQFVIQADYDGNISSLPQSKKIKNIMKKSYKIKKDNNNNNISSNNDINGTTNLIENKYELNPKNIDAYWLQRELIANFPELETQENEARKKADMLLKALDQDNIRDIENDIYDILGFTKNAFNKFILKHKDIIVWCTKLKRATDEERAKITKIMANDSKLCKILEELETMHGTAEARSKQLVYRVYREAQNLKNVKSGRRSNNNTTNSDAITSEVAWYQDINDIKQDIDLDELIFREGGHFVSNKDWKLKKNCEHRKGKG